MCRATPLALVVLCFISGLTRLHAQDMLLASSREQRIAARISADADERFLNGEYRRAQTGYRKAGLYRPRDWSLKLDLAHALLAEGDYDYAAYAVRRGLDLHPEPVGLQADLREVFASEERFKEVGDRLERFVVEHPLNRDGHFCLAYYRMFSGDEDGARESFHRVLEIQPKDRYARLLGERLAIDHYHEMQSSRTKDLAASLSGPSVDRRVSGMEPGPAESYRLALIERNGGSLPVAVVPAPQADAAGVAVPDEPSVTGDELEARPPAVRTVLPPQGRRVGMQPWNENPPAGRPRLTDR
ncbi:MAG: hypothetical protein RL885_28990 [Planctomycetota bacterium]